MQASVPFASFVWTVNFQFSNRSICTFVVEHLTLNIVTFSANRVPMVNSKSIVLAVLISKTHGSNKFY